MLRIFRNKGLDFFIKCRISVEVLDEDEGIMILRSDIIIMEELEFFIVFYLKNILDYNEKGNEVFFLCLLMNKVC